MNNVDYVENLLYYLKQNGDMSVEIRSLFIPYSPDWRDEFVEKYGAVYIIYYLRNGSERSPYCTVIHKNNKAEKVDWKKECELAFAVWADDQAERDFKAKHDVRT